MSNEPNFSTSSYFDGLLKATAIKLLPGQYHATADGMPITTVLGSCVSVCLYDPVNLVGGMNHFMLPGEMADSLKQKGGSARYGVFAMKLTLEHVIRLGGNRSYLEAKVFGAGRVMDGMSDVGKQNAEFALRYLKEENIRIVAVDVGDIYARKVCFYPATGRVFVKRIQEQKLPPEVLRTLFVADASQP